MEIDEFCWIVDKNEACYNLKKMNKMNKMIKKSASRISFSDYDATHLYELALEHFLVSEKEGVCHVCLNIKTRLEKMIGKKEVARVKRNVKLYPYNKA